MVEWWIYIVCFLTAIGTLLTGFGLGTVLTPVFALLFDVKLAITIVAVVHFFNNVFKFGLFWRQIDFSIVKRFGLLSLLGALIGSFLQLYMSGTAVKALLGVILVLLGIGELIPSGKIFRFPKKFDPIGGFLSGLLGGFVGNQGAIRTAYLLNYDISKEAFIATATTISLIIDLTRLPVYVSAHAHVLGEVGWELVAVVVVTYLGTLFGKRLLKSISVSMFRKVVAAFVIGMGTAYAFGLL